MADVVAADTVAGVAPCTMGTFRKENHISKHTEECSSMGNHGNRWLSHRGWCFISADKPCDETSPPASDMQSQRKAGQHSRERGRGEMKDEGGGGRRREKCLLPSNQRN